MKKDQHYIDYLTTVVGEKLQEYGFYGDDKKAQCHIDLCGMIQEAYDCGLAKVDSTKLMKLIKSYGKSVYDVSNAQLEATRILEFDGNLPLGTLSKLKDLKIARDKIMCEIDKELNYG